MRDLAKNIKTVGILEIVAYAYWPEGSENPQMEYVSESFISRYVQYSRIASLQVLPSLSFAGAVSYRNLSVLP